MSAVFFASDFLSLSSIFAPACEAASAVPVERANSAATAKVSSLCMESLLVWLSGCERSSPDHLAGILSERARARAARRATARCYAAPPMRPIARALAGHALAAASALLLAPAISAAPYVPKDDTTVLERLPIKPGDSVARELRELRARLASQPDDLDAAVSLGRR